MNFHDHANEFRDKGPTMTKQPCHMSESIIKK